MNENGKMNSTPLVHNYPMAIRNLEKQKDEIQSSFTSPTISEKKKNHVGISAFRICWDSWVRGCQATPALSLASDH